MKKEMVQSEKRKEVVKQLLSFVTEKRRDFPWRKKQTGYRVLVSELMLQQTQVSRVVEKYEDFLKCYPNLLALRETTLSELLLAWKGLGYMRRIKSLKAIAMQVAQVPRKREDLLVLPGIGDYTGGAIMTFAYNEFFPILETNIKTVLCFHFCHKKESTRCLVLDTYKVLVSALYVDSALSPRLFYEAMMDYGSELKKRKVVVCKAVRKQKPFKGSSRELRAKLLYQITNKEKLDTSDPRSNEVLLMLVSEGFIFKTFRGYEIVP